MAKLQDLILYGAIGSRPTAGIPGRIYLASDGDEPITRDNGTSWDVPAGSALDEETVQDLVGAMLVAGDNIDITYDDPSGTVTFDVTVPALSSEEVQDIVGAMFVNGGGVTATYSDGSNNITLGFNYGSGSLFETGVQSVVVSFFSNRLLPSGGATNQLLMKNSGTNYDVGWNDLPAGWFVPAGGTTGQVLKKTSNDDYDTEWATDEEGSGDPVSLTDLTDVTLTSPATGDVLMKGVGDWANIPLADILAELVLGDLADVDVSPTPSEGQLLARVGSGYAFVDPPEGTSGSTEPFRVLFTSEGNVALLSDGRIATGAN